MNALDISGRRLGASVRPQPVKSSLPRADLPQTFESRVMHSWAVAGHWLGVLDRALLEAVEAPGALGEAARWQIQGDAKRIRARLALAAGHAMGADMLAVVRVAAAVELLHEASLVHDDLQDRDTLRRGKNTVWVEYGEALAITLGDWMINQAYDVLLQIETDPPKLRQIARAMSKAVAATVCGQARENVAKSSLTTSPSDYIEMATGKTAPLLSFPLESAALLAGRTEQELAAIRSGLECLGGAYQLRDDLIDLLGEKGRGEAGADLIEGKATLPVLLYYAQADHASRVEMTTYIQSDRDNRAAFAAEFADRLVHHQVFDEVCEMVEGLVQMGHQTLQGAPPSVCFLVRMVFSQLLTPIQRQTEDKRVAVG